MDFHKLFLYKQWSDQRLFQAIAQIDQANYLEDYHFAQQQLNHMMIVEELFRSRFRASKSIAYSNQYRRFACFRSITATN